ncbi:MAG: hypothetical protein PSN37_02260 [Alphaproteobacteria bacterium]|nr:hypothetical protein [Alphaproteobacteria bacterium]
MRIRTNKLKTFMSVLLEPVEQRQRSLNEVYANHKRISGSLDLLHRERELLQPLAKGKIISETEILRTRKEISSLERHLNAIIERIEQIKAVVREAQLQFDEQNQAPREEFLSEMNKRNGEPSFFFETMRGAANRLKNAEFSCLVNSVLNKLEINKIGGVVNAGQKIIGIVLLMRMSF